MVKYIDHYSENLIKKIWPEIIPYMHKIYLIDAQLSSIPTSLLTIPEQVIIDDILNAIQAGKTHILFYMLTESPTLDMTTKIQNIADRLSSAIDPKKVLYITGACDGAEAYEKLCIDNNWKTRISVISANAHYFSLSFPLLDSLPIEYRVKKKEKIFLCFNKMPRQHRLDLLEMMLEHNYVDCGFYSFEGSNYWDVMPMPGSNDPTKYPNIKKNSDKFPLRLNITPERTNPTDLIEEDIKYFEESYFSIVTETPFYDGQSHGLNSTFITEKTLKCLGCMHPFIMLGRPNSLSELRRIGYKTFSPMIDESYDLVENDTDRLTAIFKEIHVLMKKTSDEWITWLIAIKEIVEHNKNHFHSSTEYSSTKNIEKYFI